jgi:ceramide glucosyltransferase
VDTTTALSLLPVATSVAVYGTVFGAFGVAVRRRRRQGSPPLDRAPRVTVLKPVAGVDEDLRENLESFARLDYPAFELLIGVADPRDPAVEVAYAFLRAHPELDARIVHTDPDAAINPKVAQLLGLERQATGEMSVHSPIRTQGPVA